MLAGEEDIAMRPFGSATQFRQYAAHVPMADVAHAPLSALDRAVILRNAVNAACDTRRLGIASSRIID